MSKITRRPLGNTNEMVSEISFGAMNLRRLHTIAQAYEILNFVLDNGINLIDTARAYNGTNGSGEEVESEVLVGTTIRQRTDLKEPILIVTKGHGYTPDEFDSHLTTSLEKLGITGKGELKIGGNQVKLIYLFHGINKERWESMTSSGVLEHARKRQQEGLFTYLGFSSHYDQVREIETAINTGYFNVIELPNNIYNRTLTEGDGNVFQLAREKGVGLINMKALGGNGFASLYHVLKDYTVIDYKGMIKYCLGNPCISTIDAGAMYVQDFQVDMDASLEPPLSATELSAMKVEADRIAPLMKGSCRECLHCLEKFECPQGIDFPKILSQYSRYKVNKQLNRPTKEFRQAYAALDIDAEACIECGECLPWCEYNLAIPEILKEAHSVLTA